jgi:hypothetical protein
MTVNKEDLRDFTRFVEDKLANGGGGSLVELACEWQLQQPTEQSDPDNLVIEADPETMRKLAEAFPGKHEAHQLQDAISNRRGVTTAEMIGRAVLAAARAARK